MMRPLCLLALSAIPLAARAQAPAPTLMYDGAPVEHANPVLTSLGNLYIHTADGIFYQDGTNATPNPIAQAGDTINGATLDPMRLSIGTTLSPVFNSNYVILNNSFNAGALTQTVILDPLGGVAGSIDSMNPLFAGLGTPAVGVPFGIGIGDPAAMTPGDPFVGYLGTWAFEPVAAAPLNPLESIYALEGFNVGAGSGLRIVPTVWQPSGPVLNDSANGFFSPVPAGIVPYRTGFQMNGLNDIFFNLAPGTTLEDAQIGLRLFDTGTLDAASGAITTEEFVEQTTPLAPTDLAGDTLDRTFVTLLGTEHVTPGARLSNVSWVRDGAELLGALVLESSGLNGTEPGAGDCDCGKADLNNDGMIDAADLIVMARGYIDPASGSFPDLDVNNDGRVNLKDYDCIQHCATILPGSIITPGFTNPRSTIKLIETGEDAPGHPGQMVMTILRGRSNNDGVAVFGVVTQGPMGIDDVTSYVYLLDDSGMNTLFSTRDDLGQGVIGELDAFSNVNERGQFAVQTRNLDDERTVYRFDASTLAAAMGTPTPTPTPAPELPLVLDFRIAATSADWLSGAKPGFGGEVAQDATFGICMTVDGPGDNIVKWVSPPNLIPLIDGMAYRVRLTVSTDQSGVDAIPLFNFLYSNTQANFFSNYGGERWIWDSSNNGGAQGIGRPQGRSTFDFFFAPIAVSLPQWRAFNDAGSTAFDPEADPINDMQLSLRVLDLGSGADPLLSANDSGTICVEAMEVTAFAMADLRAGATTVYAAPLSDGSNAPGEEDPEGADRTHFPRTFSEVANFPTVLADIMDGDWNVSLPVIDAASDPLGLGTVGVTIGPDLVAGGPRRIDGLRNPLRLYPLIWETDALYMIRPGIRSDVTGGVEGTSPVDIIVINHETFTAELGGLDYITSGLDFNGAEAGDGGGMLRAGSPRLPESVGGVVPEYVAFFYGNNATLSTLENAAGWKAQVQFVNRQEFNGAASGIDPLTMERFIVDRIALPPPE